MKNSSDIIGNQTRGLPVCSAVPQPLRHRVPRCTVGNILISVTEEVLVFLKTQCHYKILSPLPRFILFLRIRRNNEYMKRNVLG
jgi:hypothetical protein